MRHSRDADPRRASASAEPQGAPTLATNQRPAPVSARGRPLPLRPRRSHATRTGSRCCSRVKRVVSTQTVHAPTADEDRVRDVTVGSRSLAPSNPKALEQSGPPPPCFASASVRTAVPSAPSRSRPGLHVLSALPSRPSSSRLRLHPSRYVLAPPPLKVSLTLRPASHHTVAPRGASYTLSTWDAGGDSAQRSSDRRHASHATGWRGCRRATTRGPRSARSSA
jgi:hypothetical protein